VLVITLLLAIATIGVGATSPAAAQGDYVGVWQGHEIGNGVDGGLMVFAIDEDDQGNIQWFMYHENAWVCEGSPGDPMGSGAWFGRGQRVSSTQLLLPWDRVWCLDGHWHDDSRGKAFDLRLENGSLVNHDPDVYVQPGDGWVGTPVCDPTDGSSGTIWGTDGDDIINGTKGPDIICGLEGDDKIWGRNGDDIVIGGPGDDELYGNNGIEILWGGLGADILYGGFHTDGVFGHDGDDEVRPQAGHDYGYGGNGADALDGFFGHDRLEGGPGDDDAWGRNGNDDLLGGTGDDFLSGGAGGGDSADGEDGRDTCNAETEANCEF
jgi:Ca2+-binding RTX toxin-like protein